MERRRLSLARFFRRKDLGESDYLKLSEKRKLKKEWPQFGLFSAIETDEADKLAYNRGTHKDNRHLEEGEKKVARELYATKRDPSTPDHQWPGRPTGGFDWEIGERKG